MGFLKKMKNKVKGFANRFQLDDKLAEEIYNIMRKWDGNTGLKFYERERIDTDDTTYTNAQGEEVEGTEVEVKNEKWKAKIKVPNGKLKLEIEDEGKGRLEVEGKVKKDGKKKELEMDVMVNDFAFINDDGEVEFKDLDKLEKKLKKVFGPLTGNA